MPNRRLAAILGLVAASWFAPPLPAQPPASQEQAPPRAPQAAAPFGAVISIAFPGGTVEEYIRALRDAAAGEPVNVIVAPDAASVRVGPLRLDSVPLFTALSAVKFATDASTSARWQVSPIIGEFGTDAAPAFGVRLVAERSEDGRRATEPPRMIVLSLRDLVAPAPGGVAPMPAEAVLTAVESAIELAAEGDDQAQIKFHEDTGVLMVRGTSAQIVAARDVVSELTDSVVRERERAHERTQLLLDLRADRDRAHAALRVEQVHLDEATSELMFLRRAGLEGTVGDRELDAAKRQAMLARLGVERAQKELEYAEARLAAAEAGLAWGRPSHPEAEPAAPGEADANNGDSPHDD